MNTDANDEKELLRLCGRMVDGQLDKAEWQSLSALLSASVLSRAFYGSYMDAHARLLLHYEPVPVVGGPFLVYGVESKSGMTVPVLPVPTIPMSDEKKKLEDAQISGEAKNPASSPDDSLPLVQAPNTGFILQLFFIPMVIVTIIVVICLLFSGLAHMGANPRDLVRNLEVLNEGSWQKAFTLSNLLRDRKHEHIKYDEALARDLTVILQSELKKGSMEESRILLRVYLCRALGEFRVAYPIEALQEASSTERDSKEIDVRYAAIEAIALMAQNVEDLKMRESLVDSLIVTSREATNNPDIHRKKGELRSASAFALGVLGGDKAETRLFRMLDDAYANARYNAATGLARQGDERCQRVLVEMLDPTNEQAVAGEDSRELMDHKRHLVIMNAVRAARMLHEASPDADLSKLKQQLRVIRDSSLPRPLRNKATEALAEWNE